MAKMWEPMKREIYLEWIRLIVEDGDDLTKWEEDFIENITNWLDSGRNLSERQAEILERIYAEKTN